jgi:hypothetical protein
MIAVINSEEVEIPIQQTRTPSRRGDGLMGMRFAGQITDFKDHCLERRVVLTEARTISLRSYRANNDRFAQSFGNIEVVDPAGSDSSRSVSPSGT